MTNGERPSNSKLRGKRLPFVGLVLAAMLGILGEEILRGPSWLFIVIVLGIIGGWCFLRRWRQSLLLMVVILIFGILHAWQWDEAPGRKLAAVINNNSNIVLVKGVVASEVKHSGKNHVTFFIKTEQLEWNSLLFLPHITMLVHWEGEEPCCGDLLSFRAVAQSPSLPKNPGEFNKVAWLARQQIYTELSMDPSEPGAILASRQGFFLKYWALQWRSYVEKLLELGIEGDLTATGIIKGILLGIKEKNLSFKDFQLTGTMHLFAVSGLHVGMVVFMIWAFLKLVRIPTRKAVPITLLFLACYIMMTGCHIGSLRAGVMAAIVLIGQLMERRPQILNNLTAAAFLLLLLDTNLLFSMGWQFSFSVVLAIVLLTPSLERLFKSYLERDPFLPRSLLTVGQKRWQHIGKHVAQLIGVSVAAWVGALVPTICYFHQLSFSALGANVLAVPLTFLIMLTGLLAIGTGLFSSSLAIIFNNANWLFVKIVLLVVHGFSLLPGSSFSVALPLSDPQITLFDFPHAEAMVLQTLGKTWVINTGRANQAESVLFPFLEQSGISHLEGLLLTQTDAGAVGGASLLLEEEKPSVIIGASEAGRGLYYHRFLRESEARHYKVTPPSKAVTFSQECWGEFLTPSDRAPWILKVHLRQKSLLMIPDFTLAEWFSRQDSQEMLAADILYLPWRPRSLASWEPLLSKVQPKILILPEVSTLPSPQDPEEQKVLEKYGIKVFDQKEVGAIIITLLNGQTLRVKGWRGHQEGVSFL